MTGVRPLELETPSRSNRQVIGNRDAVLNSTVRLPFRERSSVLRPEDSRRWVDAGQTATPWHTATTAQGYRSRRSLPHAVETRTYSPPVARERARGLHRWRKRCSGVRRYSWEQLFSPLPSRAARNRHSSSRRLTGILTISNRNWQRRHGLPETDSPRRTFK